MYQNRTDFRRKPKGGQNNFLYKLKKYSSFHLWRVYKKKLN